MTDYLHWPFYCEENIWQLCAAHGKDTEALVVVISNERQAVAMWEQRAGREEDGFIVWDYHVVMLLPHVDGWQVLDLDCRQGHPMRLADYLALSWQTSPRLPGSYAPHFRVIPAKEYQRGLRSDRSHMRSRDGGWLRTPPPWPQLASHSNLGEFISMGQGGPGEVMDAAGFRERFGA